MIVSDIVRRARWTAAYLLCLTVAVAFFFKGQIASGFTRLLGERFDGGIETAVLEHWFNVLRGAESWASPLYFFPYKAALGFNDGFFLLGLPYAGFRAVGFSPFTSAEGVNIVLRIVGFVAMEVLLRRGVRLSRGWALFGAVLFTIACNTSMRANHPQLLTVCFVPLFAMLVWDAARAFSSGDLRRFLGFGGLAAVLMGAWLFTAYYMAWFTMLAAAVCAAIALMAAAPRLPGLARGLAGRAWAALAVPALVFVAAAIPFLRVYLPKARETGGHSWAVALPHATDPLDLVFVGDGNLFYSRANALFRGFFRPGEPSFSEHTTGFTPLLLLLFGLALLHLARRSGDADSRPLLLIAIATTGIWCLTLRIDGVSLWYWVYHLVPGAKGLRVIVRYQLWLTVPVVVLATTYLARLAPITPAPAMVLLAGMLLLEQVVVTQPIDLDRPAETAQLRSVPAPPAGCRAFFVSHARKGVWMSPEVNAIYSHNVDAMLLAERFGLPTINGFSTFNPPDWNFADPELPDYLDRVKTYAARHAITGLCALDLAEGRWDAAPLR